MSEISRPPRELLPDILMRGSEDWLAEQDIYSLILQRTSISEYEMLRAMSIGVIRELMAEGLVEPTTYGEPWDVELATQFAAAEGWTPKWLG